MTSHATTARALCALFAALSLTACGTGLVTPARDANPSEYKTVSLGKVQAASVQAATDCVMDALDTISVWAPQQVRQQRRVGGYRVEVLLNGGIMTSADILDSGEVRWSERSNAVVSANKQQDAVKACTKKFA